MFDLKLKTARVISIDDSDEKGKIQISIESEFENIDQSLLPWAVPLFSNLSDSSIEMHLPAVNSLVWILVDKYYKRFYYLSNRYFYGLFDFSKVKGLLDKCEKINTEYKNIDCKYYSDGTLLFHNNSDGSSGIITKHGTSIFIDKDGTLNELIKQDKISKIEKNKNETIEGTETKVVKKQANMSYKNKFTLESDGEMNISSKTDISLKSKTNSLIEIGNSINTLGSILTELCNDLSMLVTTGSSNSHTSPTLTSQMNILLAKIKLVLK